MSVPLLAVGTGYSASQVGLLVALSALSQLLTRSTMGLLMRKLPDRSFVVAAGILIAMACIAIASSTTPLIFALSQVMQGAARAFFFTGIQTHVVRLATSAVGGLSTVNFYAGLGSLIGPAVAGILFEYSIDVSLAVGALIGVFTTVPAALLIKLPVFAPIASIVGRTPGAIWRRPGVDAGCWMGITAGGWKGLLDSYVPVVLSQAGHSASIVGILVSIANVATLLGSASATWIRRAGIRRSLVLGIVATGLGTAAVGLFAGQILVALCALAVSGLGAGSLQTVGPAIAADSVHSEESGEAIAATGVFRAAALFLVPFGMAGTVLIAPVGIALLLAGAAISIPAAIWRPTPMVGPE